MIPKELIEKNAVSYPEIFKIDLKKDPFPWFLLSVLFGARISENIAKNTFFIFKSENLLSPEALIDRGWDGIVAVLDTGGYVRYDFKTATKILELSENVIREGGLNKIHEKSKDFDDLVRRLKSLAKGIGDVTVGIFMREMVGVWEKARPYPSKNVIVAAENLGIDLFSYGDINYGRLEYFLMKIGKNCIKGNCDKCIVKEYCKRWNLNINKQ